MHARECTPANAGQHNSHHCLNSKVYRGNRRHKHVYVYPFPIRKSCQLSPGGYGNMGCVEYGVIVLAPRKSGRSRGNDFDSLIKQFDALYSVLYPLPNAPLQAGLWRWTPCVAHGAGPTPWAEMRAWRSVTDSLRCRAACSMLGGGQLQGGTVGTRCVQTRRRKLLPPTNDVDPRMRL